MERIIGKALIAGENIAKKVANAAGKIEEATKKGVEKAEEIFDVTKEVVEIKAKISRNKVELDELFTKYGKLCYYVESDEQEAESVATSIADIECEIGKLEKQLEELTSKDTKEPEVYCTKCGAKGDDDDAFCGKCGGQLKK